MTRMMYLGYGNGRQFAIIVEETKGRWKIRRLYGRGGDLTKKHSAPWVAPTDTFISKTDKRIIHCYDDETDLFEIESQHKMNLYNPPADAWRQIEANEAAASAKKEAQA